MRILLFEVLQQRLTLGSGRCFGWLIVDPIKVVLKSQLGISRGAMQLYFVKNSLDFVLTKIIVVESSDRRDLGRIHLVLNKTLTDDTSVKRAQIKTFFCFIQFC